ncbi:bifunctional tRNA (5-methylaminomethyl-2-thiouridine)(34)-methyltransferase MnmD/FAD-dependent 5-carboxymethylaminomethyl-2-thiouridine(34) oxidoreductase MnmC [Porticoccus sp. W117]|uniref:bifunctional tRNA (5-methylaminomethyl-2-thiouridine)(34)-methyltransferase MnmD/FAD-dependent 5-carboxymethylaminomethyl-2-thiouridine(34) oxidoreductase MnmC n=1 Tax=Porticoccus sp. W117 TaxID=3054777 RepID=UPI002593FD05|nr:bifunctional tRNA (5-methylaminomethyl-2-thiouridine)(34)-methyltransferase MnmD/FAD-dependent 5-carboxymethylaminomethyl-2-thiouridine(34) oxidoreductase MnmC [Porticoccus sp. W117]MDM3872637.1 bifunctional tRNA (5-methylaminomethyl-2-thiouridine)(34)-methyltransferase MnmD/FAD-dependent 5-carboxymethylaminomethyl-2-thiouridine(34) oxidoreductase MnmC [Porticoccus sp. W117]
MSKNILKPAELEWDDNGQPISSQYGDVYFSRASGIEETRYVFLHNNHLQQRWRELPDSGGCFTIAETGFGTGLNFLCAAQLWLQTAPANWRLHFVSGEKFPLSHADLEKALALWPELGDLAEELKTQYPPQLSGFHSLWLQNGRIQLTLLFGDAADMFEQLKGSDHPVWRRRGNPTVNAWFLDGFAPAKNPDMWSEALFHTIADLSDSGTTAATFTAAGHVRRGLQAVGFKVEKVAGFGSKREMLRGQMVTAPIIEQLQEALQPATHNSPVAAPWYLNLNSHSAKKQAVVVGGGIAGCSAAHALARRGWQVTLLERHGELAQEASGNPQGIIYPKFSKQDSPLSRFGLCALAYASRYYQPLWQREGFGEQCGVLLLSESDKQSADFPKIGERFANSPELVQWVNRQQAADLAGLPLASNQGLFCPQLGWVVPPKVCRELVQHPAITVVAADVNKLVREDDEWQLLNAEGKVIAASETVVLACSHSVANFQQTEHLPLKRIRGQITQVPSNDSALKTVICGAGYIAPAHQGQFTLGATYNLRDDDPQVRDSDHQTNLQKLTATDTAIGKQLPDTAESLTGRVGFRCTTPDYLPMAGPAPIASAMNERFALLHKNARAHIPLPGEYHPGLYISCGYGSRGLSYAPLAAELLAAQICGEVAPIDRELAQALNPARFLIRSLKRG